MALALAVKSGAPRMGRLFFLTAEATLFKHLTD